MLHTICVAYMLCVLGKGLYVAAYKDIRNMYIGRETSIQNLYIFRYIMKSENPQDIVNLAHFVYSMFKTRKSLFESLDAINVHCKL